MQHDNLYPSVHCILGDIRLWLGDPSSRRVKGFRHPLILCPSLGFTSDDVAKVAHLALGANGRADVAHVVQGGRPLKVNFVNLSLQSLSKSTLLSCHHDGVFEVFYRALGANGRADFAHVVQRDDLCLSVRCILGDIRLWLGDPSSRRVKGFRHPLVSCPSLGFTSDDVANIAHLALGADGRADVAHVVQGDRPLKVNFVNLSPRRCQSQLC